MTEHAAHPDDVLLASGVPGVDNILRGGFPAHCLYLISGEPGSGKTTLAIQFLLKGARLGETCLYVTLSETKQEIEKVARSHGWDISKLIIHELIPSEQNLSADQQLTIFNPSELELGVTTESMIAAVEKHKPSRVVIDSLSELRLVAQNPLRYRRQILALKQFFAGRSCTVLMLDDRTGGSDDGQVESIAHGVIVLHQLANQYGAERRRLRVAKMRGVAFRGGFHDFMIRRGGLDVFPDSFHSPVDTTYLADNVILFRYFESRGRVRRAISVVKKRNGKHESTIRELHVTEKGLEIGEPLEDFQGVLTGVPTYVGDGADLQKKGNE